MNLAQRLPNLQNICGIGLDFSVTATPSHTLGQHYYDSYLSSLGGIQPVYYGKRSVSFTETSKPTRAGDVYESTLEISFPNNDATRALRIEEFKKAKYVLVQLSRGEIILLGRNDFFQNTPPKITTESNQQITSVQFKFLSMQPSGFLPVFSSGLLPSEIPINLINLQ